MREHPKLYGHSKMSRNQCTPLSFFTIILALLASSSIAGCTGSGNAGIAKGTGTATISIATQPVSQTVTAGQTATFSVVAIGNGTLTYQWNKNGMALSRAVAASYTTPATTSSDNASQFTVTVADSASSVTSNAAALTVNASLTPPALTVTSTSLTQAFTNQPYSATLTATGGTPGYAWSIASGSLPVGLSLLASTGQIAGTPTVAGTYSFTVRVADSGSPQQTATLALTIMITKPVDQYGGRMDISCSNTTGVFTFAKVNNRWWFCTPAGHVFISMDIPLNYNGNPTLDANGFNTYSIYGAKYAYGTDTNGIGVNREWQALKRATSWGFNATGLSSNGFAWETCNGADCNWPAGVQPIPVPTFIENHTTLYASVNRFGWETAPIKDGMDTAPPAWVAARGQGNDLFDIFDPEENTEINAELADTMNPVLQKVVQNSPWVLGYITDDSDWFVGVGGGPDFYNVGTSSNLGFLTMMTSPVQTFIKSTRFLSKSFLYPDTLYHTKAQATNPSSACSVMNPCSLRDYLWQKYNGSISALNIAWGTSGHYTTFDSSGTQVTGETIGTGNGSIHTFTHTLAHSPVSPFTVLISVGGTAQVGDYPWFKNSGTVDTGQLLSPTSNYVTSSTINYSTGAVSITFVTAPASGAAIAINYIYGGWMAGGTGLMDESGSGSWLGTNSYCLEGADPNYPTYFLCTGAGGHYEPVPNANATFGADIDGWVSQYMAKYAKNFHDDLRATGSKIPYFGLDSVGGWGSPPYKGILQGEAPYVDMAFTPLLWFAPTTTFSPSSAPNESAEFPSAYQYLTQYWGDKPLGDFLTIAATRDSDESFNAASSTMEMPTQAVRGQMHYNTVNYLLTTPGYNGDTQFVEFNQWAWQDFQNENWGLVSLHDNAYDGHEAVRATVSCTTNYTVDPGAACGGDTGNYGDAITPVRAANLLWLLQ